MSQSASHACHGRKGRLAAFALVAAALMAPIPSHAGDTNSAADATYAEIQGAMGHVPSFVKLYPKAAIAGAWAQTRELELSDKTALSPKVKALIGLAVAAQIPCSYCIWLDTKTARQNGATDEEVAEAVALAGLTRHWSTFFNGMQIDLTTFKKDFSEGLPGN